MTVRTWQIFAITLLLLFAHQQSASASKASAWKALSSLDIATARADFAAELKKRPNDEEMLRGSILAAYFDLDDVATLDFARQMVDQHPESPYLMPIFELIAAELSANANQTEIEYLIGKAVSKQASPAAQYLGRWVLHSVSLKRTLSLDSTVGTSSICPGGWVIGPYDNESNVSSFRKIAFEGEILDTLATGRGRLGSLMSWDYIELSPLGQLPAGIAMEDAANAACQFRTFFELPAESDVNIALGGDFSIRVLVDGVKVHADPIQRNSVTREAIQVHLSAGLHEITIIAGHPRILSFRFEVLNGQYGPIPGLRWPRFADVSPTNNLASSVVHPIFGTFNDGIKNIGRSEDTRFWDGILRIYNAYEREVVADLEPLADQNSLSALDRFALYRALGKKGESTQAGQILQSIRETAKSPLIESEWIGTVESDYSATIKSYIELAKKYPNRAGLELFVACEPLLNGDVAKTVENAKALKLRFPEYVGFNSFLISVYNRQLNDIESGYKEFQEYCDESQLNIYRYTQEPSYLLSLGRYDEAATSMNFLLRKYAFENTFLYSYSDILSRLSRQAEMLPLLDSLIADHPSNIELYSLKYSILRSTGDLKTAYDQLATVHKIKPAATSPYRELESLRNGCSLDSIFGTPDVSTLWDVQPTDAQKGDASTWSYLDRQQILVFESGVTCTDMHFITVLLDQQAVESYQRWALGYEDNDENGKVLIARRLRKGVPPLDAQMQGVDAYFQDLKPGDAVEVRRRTWLSNGGDLYSEYWNDYTVLTGDYQHLWEHTVLTTRNDIRWETIGPVPEPKIDQYCGFRRIKFTGAEAGAQPTSLGLLPAAEPFLGRIYFTTLKSWQAINDWYLAVSEAVLNDNPRADAWARRANSGNATKRDVLQKIYTQLVTEIPYQVMDFNYDGSIPQRPDDVILNQWGDCKDKSHLLIKMLRTSGIPAWPILVMTRSEGQSMPLPQFAFDHEIIGCVLDSDTLYIDPSSSPLAYNRSITSSVAGQPFLAITASSSATLHQMPPLASDDSWTIKNLVLRPDGENLSFVFRQEYRNSDAAFRREDHKGQTTDAFRRTMESDLSEIWELDVVIDSLQHDSLITTSEKFEEVVYGHVPMRLQKVGSSQILTLPNLSMFGRSYPSYIAPSQSAGLDIPVDLHSIAGKYERSIELYLPSELGDPQVPEPTKLSAAGSDLELTTNWDPSMRKLALNYNVQIADGEYDRLEFAGFTRKIIDLFGTPVLLMSPK